jgi:hypothetical protein
MLWDWCGLLKKRILSNINRCYFINVGVCKQSNNELGIRLEVVGENDRITGEVWRRGLIED